MTNLYSIFILPKQPVDTGTFMNTQNLFPIYDLINFPIFLVDKPINNVADLGSVRVGFPK